jgi:hypothetical protein
MDGDITGKDEAIVAEAMVIAAAHWTTHTLPKRLADTAPATPMALYIAVKYLQSLPDWDEARAKEYPMTAILVGRYPDFVEHALETDPAPADLAVQS